MDGTRTQRIGGRHTAGAVIVAAVASLGPVATAAQGTYALPFDAGERLTYQIRADKMHASGRGTMWIEGPTDFRGNSTLLLRTDIQIGVGPFKAIDRSESWLDPRQMATLRYQKRQRQLLSRHYEDVELYPSEQRWESSHGTTGISPTDAPLDELSFIYFVRTLPLNSDSAYRFHRHYDAERNPVLIRMIGRDTLRVPAGVFSVVIAEMRVKDPRLSGEGVIRLFLSDDRFRIPVRIESELPGVGTAVFTLERVIRAPERALAGLP